LEQIAVAADCVVGVGDTAIVAWWRKDLEPRSRTQTPSRLQQLGPNIASLSPGAK
jgi:hypothetical protein